MLPSCVAAGSAPAYAGIALPRAAKGQQAIPDLQQNGSSFQALLAEQSGDSDSPAEASGAHGAAAQAESQRQAQQANADVKTGPNPAPIKDIFEMMVRVVAGAEALPRSAAEDAKAPQHVPGEPKLQTPPAPINKKPVPVPADTIALLQAGIPYQFAFVDAPLAISSTNAKTANSASTPAAPPGALVNTTHSADDFPPVAQQGVDLAAATTTSNPVAFAMRVSPADQKATNDEATVNNSPARQQVTITADSVVAPAAPHPQQEHKEDGSQDGFAARAMELDTPKAAQSFKEHFEAPETAKASEPEPEPASVTVPPAKYVSVRLAGDGTQRVDFRVIERDGIMSVSVKSADQALNRTLQEHMPELTTRLESEHFRTEVWVPKADGPAVANSAGSSSSNSNSGYSSSGSGGRQYSGGDQGPHPEWLDEVENYGRAGRQRRNNTWRQ